MTDKDKTNSFDARAARIALLSDRVLGSPSEFDAAEAEDLLRAVNIDPQELKAEFHRRFDALARQHAAQGERSSLAQASPCRFSSWRVPFTS